MASAVITVRLIRSFEHRNIQHVVYHNVDLSQKVLDFIQTILKDLPENTKLPPPFRKYQYDCLKIQHKAHGAKTSDPIINTENDDELMLVEDRTLLESGIETETEISFFKKADYLKYKGNPHTEW